MKIAIIDLGSNSARMTIWKVSGGKIEVIVNKRIYVRLSEGLSEDNLIKEEPRHNYVGSAFNGNATLLTVWQTNL